MGQQPNAKTSMLQPKELLHLESTDTFNMDHYDFIIPFTAELTPYDICSVLWRVFSTVDGSSTLDGYHE